MHIILQTNVESVIPAFVRRESRTAAYGPRYTACTRLDYCKILHKLYQHLSCPRNGCPITLFEQAGPLVRRMDGSDRHKSRGCPGNLRADHTHTNSSQHSLHNTCQLSYILMCSKLRLAGSKVNYQCSDLQKCG